jgi:hypothetical protein
LMQSQVVAPAVHFRAPQSHTCFPSPLMQVARVVFGVDFS